MYPGEREGYTEELRVLHELTSPTAKKNEPLPSSGPQFVEWSELRHTLWRELVHESCRTSRKIRSIF